jgi:hypothetical protein
MSTSTDGQLCYGLTFEEDYEFPWDGMDLDEWWRDIEGCPVESPYAEGGDYKPGITINDYFEQRRRWDDDNPLPIELVNCCSGDCPIWILAIPASVMFCRRGYPLAFDRVDLTVTYEDVQKLLGFCKRFDIEVTELKWLLSSYWG